LLSGQDRWLLPGSSLFTDALAGPYDDIHVNRKCECLDYEGELAVIIGKDCKDYDGQSDVAEYVLGYTVANDISSRFWQMPARSGNQHGYAKSFDQFGPIGPVVVSTSEIPNPGELELVTTVNGEERQRTSTGDLLFDIPKIIEHLSRGTTLRKGTVIMTGTPSGVAAFMKPPAWLKSGDVVAVEISRIGKIQNTMVIT
jgi:2-keto-4-pentenoate hydratase/2-oxohepta-3-ene-1,7-dioic acid hydratase in catechol pathway